MEILTVENFLTIRYAKMEVRRLNVLIGKQAQGKSVIAKLLYFFKSSFGDQFSTSLQNLDNKREFDGALIGLFEDVFPRYAWEGSDFSITYHWKDFSISVTSSSAKGSKLKILYCDKLVNLFKRLKSSYKAGLEQLDIDMAKKSGLRRKKDRDSVFWDAVGDKLYSGGYFPYNRTVFVPASRSFFANLQKNVFSFLASNIDIDPLIKSFGAQYESCKRFYANSFWRSEQDEEYRKKIDQLVRDVAVGDYEYKDEKDWIKNGSKSVNLANASSGQQESVPMLLILSIWPSIFGRAQGTFFIEEPEAHLFPIAQKNIVSLIATIMGTYDQQFFITTHSPYVLTAINNLILAKDAFDNVSPGSEEEARLSEFVDKIEAISFDDVSAYTINDGLLVNIADPEVRLLGASVLDEVSDSFEFVFDELSQSLYRE